MKRKTLMVIALVLLAPMILIACAGNGGTANKGAVEGEGIKDELVVAIPSDVVSMDRSKHNNYVSGTANNLIYDALYWDNMDGTYDPHIATDISGNADSTEWIITLRDDVQFANGDPLTAEDVAWTINLYVNSSYMSTSMGGIKSAEVIDDTHVLVKCDSPYTAAAAALKIVRVMNKDVYEEVGSDIVSLKPPEGIGSGPYVFVEWVSGTHLKFKRNENYSFPDKAAGISNVTLKPITESSTAMIALESGEVDAIVSLSTADVKQAEANPNIQVHMTPSLNTYWFLFNCDEDDIVSNVKVRQAISYAINDEEIINGGFDGYASVAQTIMHHTNAAYDSSFKKNEYNPEYAKQLLAEAGYKDGLTLRVDCLDDPVYPAQASIVQAQLAKIGINLEVFPNERSSFYANIQGPRNFQVLLCRLTSLVRDADFPVTFLTMPIEADENRSWCVYEDQIYYDMVMAARGESDMAKRTDMYGDIFKYINDHAMIIPTVHDYSIVAANAALKNVKPSVDVIYELGRWSW